MNGINNLGSNPISSFADMSGVENNAAPQQAQSTGNVLTQFSGGDNPLSNTPIGGLFGSLGSIFGGGKSNSPNNFDLGAIIGAIFDNPIFKLFEGIFGGGKKLDPVAVPPMQGQSVAQDEQGGLFPARAGASSNETPASTGNFDGGFSLSDVDDIDDTSTADGAANLAALENDK